MTTYALRSAATTTYNFILKDFKIFPHLKGRIENINSSKMNGTFNIQDAKAKIKHRIDDIRITDLERQDEPQIESRGVKTLTTKRYNIQINIRMKNRTHSVNKHDLSRRRKHN